MFLAAVAGQTVHIDQWQTVAAFAYPEMRWSPLPVFQSYSAYTTALDEINADRLRRAAAPTRILRERFDDLDGTPYAVDRRFVWFEIPAAMLETFSGTTNSPRTIGGRCWVGQRGRAEPRRSSRQCRRGRASPSRSPPKRGRGASSSSGSRAFRRNPRQAPDAGLPGRRVVRRAAGSRSLPARSGHRRRRADPRRPRRAQHPSTVRVRPRDHRADGIGRTLRRRQRLRC